MTIASTLKTLNAPRLRFRQYTLALAGASLLALGGIAGAVAYIDPFWLWRESPPWEHRNGGENMALSVYMRYAKPVGALYYHPQAAVLGSSRVYRGIDTEAAGKAHDLRVYNYGVSGLRGAEAVAYLDQMAGIDGLRHIVWLVDDFTFRTDRRTENGFRTDILNPKNVVDRTGMGLASVMAGKGSYDAMRTLKGRIEGEWTKSGYKRTQDRPAKMITGEFKYETELGIWDDVSVFDRSAFPALAKTFEKLKASGIRLDVAFTPMTNMQTGLYADRNRLEEFRIFRRDLAALLAQSGITLHDYSEQHPFTTQDFSNGSDENWLDSSHFRPEPVGGWLMGRFGLGYGPEQ